MFRQAVAPTKPKVLNISLSNNVFASKTATPSSAPPAPAGDHHEPQVGSDDHASSRQPLDEPAVAASSQPTSEHQPEEPSALVEDEAEEVGEEEAEAEEEEAEEEEHEEEEEAEKEPEPEPEPAPKPKPKPKPKAPKEASSKTKGKAVPKKKDKAEPKANGKKPVPPKTKKKQAAKSEEGVQRSFAVKSVNVLPAAALAHLPWSSVERFLQTLSEQERSKILRQALGFGCNEVTLMALQCEQLVRNLERMSQKLPGSKPPVIPKVFEVAFSKDKRPVSLWTLCT
jgi:hypothetical protein